MKDQSVLLPDVDRSNSKTEKSTASRLFRSVLSIVVISTMLLGVGGASPASAATASYTGSRSATHMQLKTWDGKTTCSVYNTSANSKPVARNCHQGYWVEHLFDSNWKKVGQPKTVAVGSPTSVYAPVIKSLKYYGSPVKANQLTWTPGGPGPIDGVNIYRDGVYQTTVRGKMKWTDYRGRPDSVYYIVGFVGSTYSSKSNTRGG